MHNIISRRGNKILKIHLVFLITVTCTPIRCADDAYPTLNRAALHNKIAKYEQLSQDEKNNALVEIATTSYGDFGYYKKRSQVAALVHAGADVPAVQLKTTEKLNTLLPHIVLMGDLELTALLINNKANLNESDTCGPVIYNAYTLPLTRLLIDNHALDTLNTQQKQHLFNRLMWPKREPALITEYKKYGLNPMTRDKYGKTLLMIIPEWPIQGQDMIKKAKLLLEDLSIPQIKQLLAIKNNQSQTVFDIINQEISHADPYSKDFYALHDFLKQRTDPEKYPDNPQAVTPKVESQPELATLECSVCLLPLEEQTYITTACNHIFHTDCLNIWVNQNHNCPLCRAVVE